MPQYKNPFKKGRLIIEFDVEYPKDGAFDENLRKQLFNLLDQQTYLEEKVKEDEEIPNYLIQDINEVEEELNRKNNKEQKTNDVYNSDEEHDDHEGEMHGGQTSCRFM